MSERRLALQTGGLALAAALALVAAWAAVRSASLGTSYASGSELARAADLLAALALLGAGTGRPRPRASVPSRRRAERCVQREAWCGKAGARDW